MLISVKAITPMMDSQEAWVFPLKVWYPYKINNIPIYLVSYVLQLLGGIPCSLVGVNTDCLFTGYILQICALLNILKLRLKECKIDSNFKTQDFSIYAIKHDEILRLVVYAFNKKYF